MQKQEQPFSTTTITQAREKEPTVDHKNLEINLYSLNELINAIKLQSIAVFKKTKMYIWYIYFP